MVQGVEHIALCAEDVPSLIAWYQRIFQVDLIKEGQEGPFFLRFPDGFLIEFLQTEGDIPPVPSEKEKGFRHIALTVSSLEKMVETLKTEGVEVVDDFKTVPNGTNSLSILYLWVESLELYSCIGGGELPINTLL